MFGYIKYPSGVIGHLHVSWLDPHKSRKITVVGSDKMVVFDDMEAAEKVRVYDKGAVVKVGVESYAEAITLRGCSSLTMQSTKCWVSRRSGSSLPILGMWMSPKCRVTNSP